MPFKRLLALFLWFIITPALLSLTFLQTSVSAIIPSGRPHSKWTWKQALVIQMIKSILGRLSVIRFSPKLILEAKIEESRFDIVLPVSAELCKGPVDDAEIKPTTTGGTWTPEPFFRSTEGDLKRSFVMLHFHGGAYVTGDGTDRDTGFLAGTILKNTPCTHVFTPQYRLASTPGGRFPAALQDALSAYCYLINDLNVPPEWIVLGGDSAGGNLALALLRYISIYGQELAIPWPAAVTLWSPWTNIASYMDAEQTQQRKNYDSDFLHASFCQWGALSLTGSGRIPSSDPYLSTSLNGCFKSQSPIWVHTGGKELFFEDNRHLVQQFEQHGVDIEWVVAADCPHDVILIGDKIGFAAEAREAASRAGLFLSRFLRALESA